MRQVLIPHDITAATARPEGPVRQLGGSTMGTSWSMKACAPANLVATLREELEEVLAEVVRQMSPWKHDSCLVRLNQAQAGSWNEVPADFFAVLECALSVADLTKGALDPTIGRLVDRFGFGPSHSPRMPLANDETDWRTVRLDRERRRVLQPGGVRFDLCAVAKGFAVDRLAETLEGHGVHDYLVEIGGELRGSGTKPDGHPWWVALERAPSGAEEPVSDVIVALHGLSAATSGGHRRCRRKGPGWETHLIDPRRAKPLAEIGTTVSVLARRCMEADAWATALAVVGPEEGLDLATSRGIAACFASGQGSPHSMTPAMAALQG